MSTPLIGVSLQPRWPLADGTAVLRAASRAEDLGFDHVAVGNRLLDSGLGLDTDPLVLLAAVAAATRRLRLLTSVLVAPYYPALVLANQAATLDVVSGGRLILGVGTGWNPQEFAAVGVPARERGARTDDHLAAARALWSQRPADFDGQFTTLRAARLGVPPVTPGGPTVWVGGDSDAALRRALRFGDGWYGAGVSAAGLTDVSRRLRELADGAGNAGRLVLASAAFLTPPGIAAAVPSPGRPLGGAAPTAASVVDDLGQLAEAGLTTCTLWLPIAAEHVEKAMEWIAAEVMPQLALQPGLLTSQGLEPSTVPLSGGRALHCEFCLWVRGGCALAIGDRCRIGEHARHNRADRSERRGPERRLAGPAVPCVVLSI